MDWNDLQQTPDELFASWLASPHSAPLEVREFIPDWPPDSVRRNCTGDMSFADCVEEARSFYTLLKDVYRQYGQKPLPTSSVLDFGCGWGRITRFFSKDVRPGNLTGCDPNPQFVSLFRDTRVPAPIIQTDWMSAMRISERRFDLVFAFSIFTHTSEELAHNIFARWEEILAPGGLAVFTIRPREMLTTAHDVGDRKAFGEVGDALERYERGEFVYRPYEADSPQWGVTVIPLSWITRHLPGRLKLVGTRPSTRFWTQLPVIIGASGV